MNFFYALIGDALLFAALAWFAGYGALGPVTGLRLAAASKLRLFGEVFLITLPLLYVLISLDRLLGWATAPPLEGSPPPHRLIAIGVLVTVGFLYARRRSRALAEPPADEPPRDPSP